MGAPVRYRILGQLELRVGSGWVPPTGKLANALAILLVNAGAPVASGRLVRGIWPDPPATATGQLHKLMSELRELLTRAGRGDALVSRRGVGYQLTVADGELDSQCFVDRMVAAERAAAGGGTAEAYAGLREALGWWRTGTPLAGIDCPLLDGAVQGLRRRRLRAAESMLLLALAVGDYQAIVDAADQYAEPDPTQERLWAAWIIGLYRTGRARQAYSRYEEFEKLADGGPNPLRQLGYALSRDDPPAVDTYERELVRRPRAAPVTAGEPLPLPADLPDLTGRRDQIDQALWLLSRPGQVTGPVVLCGPAGVGKTVLAVHIAHRLRDRFPDGVFFVELRGTEPQPAHLDEVLARLLRALGANPEQIPATRTERVAHYRRRLAGARVLLVLDDAPGAGVLTDLLPAGPAGPSAAVVTSQDRLAGLPGADRIGIDELDPDTAVSLFERVARAGGAVLDGDGDGPRTVAEVCGGLPLALRVAGAHRAQYRHASSSELAALIVQGNLDMLVHGQLSVPAVIAASYDRLDGPARTLLRRLALLDLPDLPWWVVAAVLDTSPAAAADFAARLVSRSLLRETGPDHLGQSRYQLHNLVRRYARQEAERSEDRAAVLARGYGALLALTEHAHRRICGGDYEIVHGTAARWHLPAPVRDRLLADPLAWCEQERANIRAAVGHTARLGLAELSWDLAISAHEFYGIRGWFDDWYETHREALAACRAAGNPRGEAAMLATLGQPSLVHSRKDLPGVVELDRAVSLFAAAGDPHGEAIARRALGSAHRLAGDFETAQRQFALARARYRDGGDPLGAWQAARLLGQTWLDLGDPARALRHLTEALALARRTGHERAEPQTTYWIGRAWLALGDVAAAAGCFDRVLASAERAGDRTGLAYGRHGLGDAAYREGRLAEAGRLLVEAREAAQLAGDGVLVGRILCSLGELHRHRREWRAATGCLAEAAARFGDRNARWLRAQALRRLGATHQAAGDPAAARAAWQQALALLVAMESTEADQVRRDLDRPS
jgi:tetratricopeptide (TPR) repeat protein